MWNAETAKRLNEWYGTPPGAFALALEYKLFQDLVSGWPRRGRSLLDVGCGTGVFLNMFWEYGFDVTGLDNDERTLEEARQRLGNKAEFRLGQLDHLPFDDGEFDYVALLSVLEYADDPRSILEEALRVAERGIVLGFVNAWSACRLADISWPGSACRRKGRWLSPHRLARMLRELCPDCRISARSVLLGPSSTWKETSRWRRLNSLRLRLPLGGYVGIRVDTEVRRPLTPLLLSARDRALSVCSGLRPETSRDGLRAAGK